MKTIFLDRDDTIILDEGYMNSPNQVQLIDGVKDALLILQQFGYQFVLISNQSGIGRKIITYDQVININNKMIRLLHPIRFAGIYFCPHKPTDYCNCRKPLNGMIRKAISELKITPSLSYIIGDKSRDLLSGTKLTSGNISGIRFIKQKKNNLNTEKNKTPNEIFRSNQWKEITEFILQQDFQNYWERKWIPAIKNIDIHRICEKIKKKPIIFTNGVFDILHLGHYQYLWQAAQLGKFFIVGLNSDKSVSRLKGKSRPINPITNRAAALAQIEFIDLIIAFTENTPEKLIQQIKPDIYVKGGDYTEDKLPETSIVHSYGGKVIILPFKNGYSTTSFISKLQT